VGQVLEAPDGFVNAGEYGDVSEYVHE
jgi:hypothetical protein